MINNLKIYIALIIIIFFFIGSKCNNKKYNAYSPSIEHVLKKAKSNRHEIEKALDYFLLQKDSLKIKAIFYLVENISDNYSTTFSEINDPYHNVVLTSNVIETKGWDPSSSIIGTVFDSIYQHKKILPKIKVVHDIDVITGDFLIYNVEKAFEAWEITKSFTKYSFQDFCEYILPYRIGNEPLNNWREQAFDKYFFLLDSLKEPIEIAKAVIKKSGMSYNSGMSKYPYSPTFKELDNLHYGSCNHLSEYLALSLRAIGIAASIDVVPAWGNRSLNHVWNVVMDKTGKFQDLGYTENGNNDILYKIPKIYRKTFTKDRGHLSYLNSNWKDVTNDYSMPNSKIILQKSNTHKKKKVFLCVFDNQTWVPIAVNSSKESSKVVFRDIGRGIPFNNNKILKYYDEGKGIVYLPACMKKNTLIAFSDPFILKENGKIHLLAPSKSTRKSIIINRKYPKYEQIATYAEEMKGAFFEASNDANFLNKTNIHIIRNISTQPFTEVKLPETIICKYIRFHGADSSRINLSELRFYNSIGQINIEHLISSDISVKLNNLIAISDNNIDTYYEGKIQNEYIDICFKEEVNLNKIVYAPRTDGNDIIPEECYELFYWDKKWKSLGKKIAKSFYLRYDNVPDNALLLLHNHTKGVEERIFTIEKDKQIWW